MVIDSFVSADESLYFDALSGAVFHAVLVVLEYSAQAGCSNSYNRSLNHAFPHSNENY